MITNVENIKIAIVTTVHTRNDVRVFVKEYSSIASAFLGSVTLYVQDGEGDWSNKSSAKIVDTGPINGGRLTRITKGSWRMFRRVLADKPDIVHFHDPELIFIALLLKLFGAKVIYDVHEDLPKQLLSKHYIRPWLRPLLAKLAMGIERFASIWFDKVVVVTSSIAEHFPEEKTVIIQNFPRVSEFPVIQDTRARQNAVNFAYVGGITAIRGAVEMINALPLVGNKNVRLKMAGEFSPESFRNELSELEGWKQVHYAGWVQREDLAHFYSDVIAGMVLFQPVPNHISAQPNKMFEYMAAGIPVIASDFPLWRRIIDEFNCGILVDPIDSAAIAAAMDWVLDNPGDAAEMGKRGQHAVAEKYNWEKESEKLIALYSDILRTPSEKVRA